MGVTRRPSSLTVRPVRVRPLFFSAGVMRMSASGKRPCTPALISWVNCWNVIAVFCTAVFIVFSSFCGAGALIPRLVFSHFSISRLYPFCLREPVIKPV